MIRPVRSGVIGTGLIGRVHVRAVRASGGVVTTVAGASLEESDAASDALGIPRSATPEELIASSDVDLVHICTPNSTHFAYAMAAIAAGKAVICEKPLAPSIGEATELLKAASRAGVVNAVPFIYRYYPAVREMRARLREDSEKVWMIRGHYLQDWLLEATDYNWRINEGPSRAFGDIGVHWCDLLEFSTGHRIKRINANATRLHDARHDGHSLVAVQTEDAMSFLFETDRGASGAAVLSQASAGKKNQLVLAVDTDRHAFQFNQEIPDVLEIGARVGSTVLPKGYETTEFQEVAEYVSVPSGHPQGFLDCFIGLISDVYRAMRGDSVPGLPTFTDGVRAAELVEAAVSATTHQKWVDVPLDSEKGEES